MDKMINSLMELQGYKMCVAIFKIEFATPRGVEVSYKGAAKEKYRKSFQGKSNTYQKHILFISHNC